MSDKHISHMLIRALYWETQGLHFLCCVCVCVCVCEKRLRYCLCLCVYIHDKHILGSKIAHLMWRVMFNLTYITVAETMNTFLLAVCVFYIYISEPIRWCAFCHVCSVCVYQSGVGSNGSSHSCPVSAHHKPLPVIAPPTLGRAYTGRGS